MTERGIWTSTWTSENPNPELKVAKYTPEPKGISWIDWHSYWSPRQGNPYDARHCTSVVSIVPLKNNTDSSLGKPHIFMRCGQEGDHAHSDKFQPTDGSGACLSEKLIHLLCRLAVGVAHLCPRMTSERGDNRPCWAPDASADTPTVKGTQVQPCLVGSQQWDCWCSTPGNLHWGLFLWVLSQPTAWIREDWLTSGLDLIPTYPLLSRPHATFCNYCRMQAAPRCLDGAAPNRDGGAAHI